MQLEPITLMGHRCRRCGHQWVPRVNATSPARVCPKCKSPYWFEDAKRKAHQQERGSQASDDAVVS
jgi:predicted Zn-ribbon and HTH transcriptional regulator